MQWYLAKLVYQIICGGGNHTAQFDEQLRLVYAEDELHAFNKARLIGDSEACMEYTVRLVQWKFIDVSELYLLQNMTDGAEIYSRIAEETDANLHIDNIHKKATVLLQQGIHQFTSINNIAIGT
jgi:Domain of unknown function (DUF4288)